MEDKTILLKVELDVAQLKKAGEEAAAKLDQLKVKQTLMRNESKQGSLEYAKLSQEIRKTSKELNDNAKAIEINDRLNKKNSGSMNEMKDQMLAAKIALGQMSEEMRKSEIGQQLIADIDAMNNSLKDTEESYGQFGRNVGNYAGALAELKKELKAMKGEMVGLDADSERYQELSTQAGILGDKIKEVNENVAAQSGGTGFEKLSNNFGLIRGDLENLDFAGVSEKMGQMAQISKSMTFKEALGGLKNMGSSLISLGKAILLNPLFLVAGAVVGIVAALKMWNDSVKAEAVAAQKAHTQAIEDTIAMMDKQAQRGQEISDLFIKRAELEGKSAKEIGDMKLKAFDDANKSEKKQIEEHRKAVESLRRESKLAESEEDRKALKDKIKEHLEAEDDLIFNQTFYSARRKNLEIETNNSILDETKNSNEKRKAESQKAYDDRISLERRMSDLLLNGITLSNDNEEKRILAKYEYLVATAEGNNEELIRLEGEKNQELASLDIKTKEEEISRITEQYRREIEDAKGKKDIIAQLKKNEALEKEQIDIEYEAKKKARDIAFQNQSEQLEKEKIAQAKRNASEIELIDSQINLLKAKGTEAEFSAWADVQFAKIRQLETIAALELENANLTKEEKIKIAKETELAIAQIQVESFEKSKETTSKQNEWTVEQKKDMALASVNAAQQLSDSLFQIASNQIQQELNDEKEKYDTKTEFLQNQLDNALITQAEFDAQKSALDSQYNAKEKALKEEQFKKNKASQIINATIAAAVGVANALAAPPPASFIMAGIAGVLGAAQIALIASQPTPTFARGGVAKEGTFGGRSHSSGGTRGVFEDGTQVEVEKDEKFIVINKNSSRMISALSNLNVRGGGIPFMQNGGVLKFASGGSFASAVSQPTQDRIDFQIQMIQALKSLPPGRILVEDINSAQGNLASVVDRANY
jgi:hypothetical protein